MQALNGSAATIGAWEAIHALSYHTYVTDLDTIINETTSLYQRFNKPLWITEIASGADSTAPENLALMQDFVPWANSQPWIERYFWNQAVSCTADSLCALHLPPLPMVLVHAPIRSPQQTGGTEVPAVQRHAAFLCVEHAISFCCRLLMRTAYGAAANHAKCYTSPAQLTCGSHNTLNDNTSMASHGGFTEWTADLHLIQANSCCITC